MTSSYYPIHENPNFEADAYAMQIETALKHGDKEKVAKLIVGISNAQRQKIKEPYRIRYQRDLDATLDQKITGDLGMTIHALMKSPLEYDVEQLFYAIKGAGTNENTLIEIICSRTPDQLKAIVARYPRLAKKSLAEHIAGDTSGDFKDLLLKLVGGSKDLGYATNDKLAHDDAVQLLAESRGKFKNPKEGSHFMKILATQNTYQLRKIFAEFHKLSGQTIDDAIAEAFSGDVEKAYLAIVHASANKQQFFASQLKNSMKGVGTRDNALVRALVTRSEVDLNLIKEEYKMIKENKKKNTLEYDIKDDTSGPYGDTLLLICAGNQK